MKILVTGGAGFIGSNLALSLQDDDKEVTIIDDFSMGSYENLEGFEGRLIQGDIRNIKLEKHDEIYHLAGISQTTNYNQAEVIDINVNGFRNLLEQTQKYNTPIVYASSASTYGNNGKPNNVYGFSKLMMEKLAHQYNGNAAGLRYFNVYGPNESHKGKSASMIYQFANALMNDERPQIFKGSSKIHRDFIYIKDVITATKSSINQNGVFDVGTGVPESFESVLDLVKHFTKDLENIYIDNPHSHYQKFTKAENSFAWKYSLSEGIQEYMHILKEQNDFSSR